MKEKQKYQMKYLCDNCLRPFIWFFERGTIAKQPECPNCGVKPEELKNNVPKYEN
jgi:DNA-directed RNA polymerase subunit RPC12/RpoP